MFEEIPKNCRYGYARVSSKSQEDNSSLEAQKDEFLRLGVPGKNIRVDADKIEDRPVFYHLIDDEVKENDLLLVTKIDRCSRNTLEFLKLQERLHKKGVTFLLNRKEGREFQMRSEMVLKSSRMRINLVLVRY